MNNQQMPALGNLEHPLYVFVSIHRIPVSRRMLFPSLCVVSERAMSGQKESICRLEVYFILFYFAYLIALIRKEKDLVKFITLKA